MNIKVCGVTSIEQLHQLDKLLVDYAGIVFDPNSYQCVKDILAADEVKYADVEMKKVGVFADAGYDEIMETVSEYGLDVVQLNGRESLSLCMQLSEQVSLIKTFYLDHFDAHAIHEMLEVYDTVCDYYSFDSKQKHIRGGITKAFDWKMIGDTSIEKPFFIGGGGIRPSDAPMIHQFKHPDFFGVDINQYFEKEPGVKDTALVLSFMRAINQVDN
jgi:phosphoribosylanthranilate isomerase